MATQAELEAALEKFRETALRVKAERDAALSRISDLQSQLARTDRVLDRHQQRETELWGYFDGSDGRSVEAHVGDAMAQLAAVTAERDRLRRDNQVLGVTLTRRAAETMRDGILDDLASRFETLGVQGLVDGCYRSHPHPELCYPTLEDQQREIHRLHEQIRSQLAAQAEEIARLRQWVHDCQSGMWINCSKGVGALWDLIEMLGAADRVVEDDGS